MADRRLSLEERLILYLSDYKGLKDKREVSIAICQEGICGALSIQQPMVSKLARLLIKKGYIEQRIAYIKGVNKARKIYYLTSRGIIKVNIIKKNWRANQ
jgi:DNA-binding MarR family transcriptional regulator